LCIGTECIAKFIYAYRLQSLHIVQQHCLWEITVWENLKLACGSSAIRQESMGLLDYALLEVVVNRLHWSEVLLSLC